MISRQELVDKTRVWLSADSEGTDPRVSRRVRRFRYMAVGIAIPTLIVFLYYAVLARPEYDTEMKFTIQGLEQRQPDLLAGIGLPAITGSANDGQVVVEYIQSAALVGQLVEDYGFDAAYGNWSFDPLARVSRSAPLEEKADFWLSQSAAIYDATSNIITVNVRAFTAEDSLRIAQGVLAETEQVVNSLNSRVQDEAVRVATEEVASRRESYNEARRSVINARASRATTLEGEAAQQVGLVGQIESQLANTRVERAAAIAQFRPSSPQIRAMDERIAALVRQRDEAIADARGGFGMTEASRDVGAQTALLDYQFAQTAYYSAIEAQRAAVANRANERRYLVAFVPPRIAEVSNYWSRFWNVFAVALIAGFLMAIGSLGYSIVKDHLE
jgi:capsular polysaccharide transport system permease protein